MAHEVDGEAGAMIAALHPGLVGALALQTGDRRLAEELAQETYVRLCERWSSVRTMESPEGWAFRVAFNLASSRFRRLAVERRAHRRVVVGDDRPDPADVLAVRSAVATLPPRQRAAVVLRYFADLSVADTAATLDCAEGTVKSLTSQAIDRLRPLLALDDLEVRSV